MAIDPGSTKYWRALAGRIFGVNQTLKGGERKYWRLGQPQALLGNDDDPPVSPATARFRVTIMG